MFKNLQERRPVAAPSQNQEGASRPGHTRKLYVGAHVVPFPSASPQSLFPRDPASVKYKVTVAQLPNHKHQYLVFRIVGPRELIAEIDYDDSRKLICNFQTHPSYRGQGWGRILMKAVLSHPLVDGQTVILNARPFGNLAKALEQTRLEAFYQSFGFEKTGRMSLKGTEMRLSPTRRRIAAYMTAVQASVRTRRAS